LSDDYRPAAVKYYKLTPKGKEIFEDILKILKK
jgi:DNA-binding PadR family transcriptional regulator